MGTARLAQMAADEAVDVVRHDGMVSLERQLEEKRRVLEARIAALRAEFEVESKEAEMTLAREKAQDKVLSAGKEALSRHRGADQFPAKKDVKK